MTAALTKPSLRAGVLGDAEEQFNKNLDAHGDYSIQDGDHAVGRMYRTSGGFRGEGYAWFIYRSSGSGFMPTRDEAAAAWKVAYLRFLADGR
jgi:hypothetical protein